MSHQPGASVARGFLFADLRGYSAFVERHGDRAGAELLQTYRDLVRSAIASFHGGEIRTEGDSFYLVFGSPSDAVLCGLAILEAASITETPSGHSITIGIGVHAGETVATDEGYVESVVNIAARVCAAARPGELLVTEAVRALTRTYLDVGFVAAGRRRLKGISETVALYRVVPTRQAARQRTPHMNWLLTPPALALAAARVLAAGTLAVSLWAAADPSATDPAQPSLPSAEGASPDASPAPFPNRAEEALRSRIDQTVARHCGRPEPDEVPVVVYAGAEGSYSGPLATEAGLRCPLGSISEPDTVWFWFFTQGWAADEFFFATAGRRSVHPGDCASEDRAYGDWEFGADEGRVLCIAGSRDAQLYWTYSNERILGYAIREDGDVRSLFSWWREHARTLGAASES